MRRGPRPCQPGTLAGNVTLEAAWTHLQRCRRAPSSVPPPPFGLAWALHTANVTLAQQARGGAGVVLVFRQWQQHERWAVGGGHVAPLNNAGCVDQGIWAAA